ncbi:hypothetical protein [Azoarcus olearius]|uniref:Conserved hypothetical membrane protein n=1 Tax=Azoarcus sp. (strain BH72) TaxID=418699 RepID=A1KBM4_AZOSB|nr:hypothetical protein [Azoarcus olearius]ANQ86774.1 hypothetical protein dqs_3757 [Azoarcus olearius]CAL96230.1 conserved hypothetical membrane protein [Azoarcus olearius]
MKSQRSKQPLRNRALALALAASLLAPAAPAFAQVDETITGDRGGDKAADLFIVRPFSLIASVLGAAGFVIALPFTIPTGTVGETGRDWVVDPLEYTFYRPLGNFHQCGRDTSLHACGGSSN